MPAARACGSGLRESRETVGLTLQPPPCLHCTQALLDGDPAFEELQVRS